MSGRAKQWTINFNSLREYHQCLEDPQVISFIRHKDHAEFNNESNSYSWKVKLRKLTSINTVRKILMKHNVTIYQTIIRTLNPVTRKQERIIH